MTKNGIISKVIYGVIMLIIVGAIGATAAIQNNSHSVEVNKNEIKRVDTQMQTLIIEQKEFQEKTTDSLHEISKAVVRIETKLEE